MKHMLTVDEVAAALRITPYTVREHCRMGTLPGATKIGRRWLIPAASVRDKLEGK